MGKKQEQEVDRSREVACRSVTAYLAAVINQYVVDDWERQEAISALEWLGLEHLDNQ